MTVAELIEKLKAMPQDMPVHVWNHEESVAEAESVKIAHDQWDPTTPVVVIE